MTTVLPPLLAAIHAPSVDMLIICIFASSLPTAFFFWLKWWLGSIKDENPDEVLRAQAKADQEHLEHQHAHGHGGGHHGADHHAHA
ncbi:MAG: hypothetical protein JNK85_03090 [Verrucomicrobiales bacterium]|nr:hypothetical protein [Verrucomicrobiales bacterium]